MANPYENLPGRAFWRPAVATRPMQEISELWSPKFTIAKTDPIATLGSCFAQHISRALAANGYNWLNAEPAPPRFPEELKPKFHYDVFSARVGNIYTTSLLLQWARWSLGKQEPSSEVWVENGRFYDPFRPAIEPDGFSSKEEVLETRAQTLRALRHIFETTSVLVFTLGLTESWENIATGEVYPMCPGVAAGTFDPAQHRFVNHSYRRIYADLNRTIHLLRRRNPGLRVLLTVSPVPLVATASGDHVLPATIYSKSTLRAVAGDLAAAIDGVDYFPSYEMISSFPFKGEFYEPNLRSVRSEGVAFVMQTFFECVEGRPRKTSSSATTPAKAGPQEAEPTIIKGQAAPPSYVEDEGVTDPVCEEMMLEELRG